MATSHQPLAVTGVRVVGLFAPFPIGGSLAVAGDPRSGVNVVAMEVMQNLCRRYDAAATCHVTVDGRFNDSNVRGWVAKLRLGLSRTSILAADPSHIDVFSPRAPLTTLPPS